jgi:hypothetical protein
LIYGNVRTVLKIGQVVTGIRTSRLTL